MTFFKTKNWVLKVCRVQKDEEDHKVYIQIGKKIDKKERIKIYYTRTWGLIWMLGRVDFHYIESEHRVVTFRKNG